MQLEEASAGMEEESEGDEEDGTPKPQESDEDHEAPAPRDEVGEGDESDAETEPSDQGVAEEEETEMEVVQPVKRISKSKKAKPVSAKVMYTLIPLPPIATPPPSGTKTKKRSASKSVERKPASKKAKPVPEHVEGATDCKFLFVDP